MHTHTHTQGLLPYDMFANKLLTSQARMLALEPEQKVSDQLQDRLTPQRLALCQVFDV